MQKIQNGASAQTISRDDFSGSITEEEMEQIIEEWIDVGVLNPTIDADDYVNARAPYDFSISFEAYEAMSGRQYIYLLRRLMKSVNLALKREARFRPISDANGIRGLQMINGFIIVQGDQTRPRVDIGCNAHLYYPQDVSGIEHAFLSTKCYVSKQNPVPIYDASTLKVSRSAGQIRAEKITDESPYLLSLNGGLIKWDH